MRLFDSHNHLQDPRFRARMDEVIAACRSVGVVRMVVNGSCESDWPDVAELARRFPDLVIPAYGYHPWHLRERTSGWQSVLERFLDSSPLAVIGEIGLDRWILEQRPEARLRSVASMADSEPASLAEQEDVFLWQLRLAADRKLPVSIHCLRAFGRMEELLRNERRPTCGFLLHSYGGPAEMVAGFARLGARFGFPACYADPRKSGKLDAFRVMPVDRLLAETDAPDQALPPALDRHPMPRAEESRPMNHPANLRVAYEALAGARGMSAEALEEQIARNFDRLFHRSDSTT